MNDTANVTVSSVSRGRHPADGAYRSLVRVSSQHVELAKLLLLQRRALT